MLFKIYLEVLTSIWKFFSGINNSTSILVYNPKVENIVKILKIIDIIKALSKKIVNDKFIETLQIGWYALHRTIRFKIGHN